MAGIRGPLSVRINDGVDDRLVTRHASGLKFSKTANGGHRSASMHLNLPRDYFADLGPSDRLWIDDARTGANLFSGYTQNPTPVDGRSGQGFDLSALGGMILASDETRPLLYVDTDLEGYEKDPYLSVESASVETGLNAYGVPAIKVQFNPGQAISVPNLIGAANSRFLQADMQVGAVRVESNGGKVDGGYLVRFRTPLDTKIIGADLSSMTTAGRLDELWVGADFLPTTGPIVFELLRTGGATNIADEQTFVTFARVTLIGRRVDRYGADLSGSSQLRSTSNVYASEVVEDLLGRLLVNCDPARAVVTPTTQPIDRLTYPDGATAQRVIDELADREADMRWGIGSDDGIPFAAGGRGHEFWYVPIDPMPRYEILPGDDYRETGSELDLCNRVAVVWTDAMGDTQTTVVVATSDQYPALRALEDAGRTHDADPIALPDGKGSANNALVVGYQKLAQKASPPRSATAVVARTVRDLWTGADLHPMEVEPGYMAHIRATGEDIYCTETEYDDDAGAVTMTLGDPIPTDEQRFAALSVA